MKNKYALLARWAKPLLCTTLLFSLIAGTAKAQAIISYPEQAGNIVACNQAGQLRVRIDFEEPSGPGTQLQINFPPGISYETGSISVLPGSIGLAEADLSDPNQPIFQLTGNAANGSFTDLSLQRAGGCQARAFSLSGGIVKDSIWLQADGGTVQENSPSLNTYNVLSASLSFQYPDGPSSQDTIVNNTPQFISRRLRLIQGGLGFIRSFTHFVVVSDGLQNFQLKHEGTTLPVSDIRGDTLFYQLDATTHPGIFGEDGKFSNGEQIDLQECFDAAACAQSQNQVKHHAIWGCSGDICQQAIPVTGTVSVIVQQPQIESGPLFSRQLPECLDGATPDQFGFFIENSGSTTARIGFQLGFEGKTNLPVFGDYNSNAASIDTASVQIWMDEEELNRSPDDIHSGVNDCANPLAVGAVSAARYRNFVLEPGQRLEIRGNYVYCCRQSCNINYSWPTPIARIQVRDACGQNPRLELASHDFAEARVGTAPAIISGPATLFDQQSTEYCFQFPKLDGYPNVSGDNLYVLEVGLPSLPGLQATGNARVTGPSGNPLPFASSGAGPGTFSMEIRQSDYDGGAVAFCFEIEWSCGSGGLIKPSVDLYQRVAPSCEASCRLPISCDEFPLLLFCPGVDCPDGGGIVDFSESERINVGRADPDNLRQWQTNAPADPSEVRLDRAAPCDTVRTRAGLGVADGSGSPWPQARFRQRLLFPFFRPLGARAEVYDNGQLIGEFEQIPLHSASGDTLFVYELSATTLHALDPGFPAGFTYDAGDSLYIEADYYFDPELAQGQMYNYTQSGFDPVTGTCVENQDLFNAFQLSNDDFATANACGSTIDRVQLVAVGATFASGGANSFAGCEAIAFEVFTRSQRGCITGEGLDFFPNEFRPLFAFDTVAFAKIPGFAFDRLEYRRSPGNVVLDILPFAVDADSIYFDLRSQYSDRGGPIPLLEENARDEILKSFWRASCSSVSGEIKASAGVNYLDLGCRKAYRRQQERSLSYTSTGQFNFVLNPLVGNAFEATTCYTLSATNTGVGSDFDVPFTWLELILPNGNINLLSMVENGEGALSPSPNGLYELGKHPNNSTRQFEICVQQNSCLPDSLQLVYGWDCQGYPGGDAAIRNCRLDTLTAYLTPEQSEVQLQIIDQPSPAEALDLCTTDTIEVLVNSAQQADLLQPALEVVLPSGIELNQMLVGYPNDASISFEALSADVSGDTATFDLRQHSRITGDSLPGTFNSPSIARRQMRLIFEIETGCGFNPLQSVALYRASGRSPCGAAAEGSDAVLASNPIRIKGTQVPYTTDPSLRAGEVLAGCESALPMQVSFTLSGGATAGRDTSEVILPAGIAYLPGSLSCNAPNQGHCPSFASAGTDSLGRNIVRFAWPAGITASDSLDFSFELKNEGAECTAAARAIFRNIVTKAPLVCMGTPCPAGLNVETGRDTVSFAVRKAALQLAPETVACSGEDGSFRLSGSLSIADFGLDSVQVQVFCSGPQGLPSEDPVAAVNLKGPFAAGQSVPFQINGSGCDNSNGLWVELQGNCACAGTLQLVPAPEPSVPVCPADTAVCLAAPPISLYDAVPAGGTFSGTAVEDGRFDPATAGTGVHTITYTLSDSLGCSSRCSFDITVLPLPALSCPPDLEVSIEAGPQQLGGASPLGGTYSGSGVVSGQFDPALAGPGTHPISYAYTNYLGCTDSCTFFITVETGNAQLGDFVWRDLNRNGIQENSEPGISGVMVILQSNGIHLDTTFTNDEGYYGFSAAPGIYRLLFQTPDGLRLTSNKAGTNTELDSDPAPATGLTQDYTVEEGDSLLAIDAGFYTLCDNVNHPGRIGTDQYLCGPGNSPAMIESVELPSGGSGALEYIWMQSKVPGPFNLQSWKVIPAATGPSYSPGPLSQTTYFARCARRENCAVFLESNIITVEVGTEAVAEIQGPDWICVGVPDLFRAMDNGPGATYEWALSPGLSPATASGAQVEVTAPNSHGAFSISLQVGKGGCTSSSTCSLTATRSPLFCAETLPLSAVAEEGPKGRQVRLSWMAEEFLQGYQYTAEYSGDGGKQFKPIGTVHQPTALLGNQHYYQLLHETAGPGANRYRLKIESPKGRSFYSETAEAILPEESSLVRLFPNPAREAVTVEINEAGSPSRQLALLSANGRILRLRFPGSQPQRLTLDLSGLPLGTYFIRISEGKKVLKVLPLVKR